MPKRLEVDHKEMLRLIKDGKSQGEIMQKLGIKTSSQFNTHLVAAYRDDGLIPAIPGTRGGGKASGGNAVKVGKRGSVIIAKEIIEACGFKLGDEFTVRQTKYGLQLRKAGAPEGPEGGDGEE